VRRLYKTPGQHLTLGQVVELNRRFLEGYVHFKDEPRVQSLRKDVLKYNRLVRDLGLRDHQVCKKLFIRNSLSYPLLGSSSSKGELEDSRSSHISNRLARRVGNLGAARHCPQ
jgi:hypothetical protein